MDSRAATAVVVDAGVLNNTHPYIVIKNSGDSSPNYTQRITVRRSIFLNWSGLADQSYLLVGEDGTASGCDLQVAGILELDRALREAGVMR